MAALCAVLTGGCGGSAQSAAAPEMTAQSAPSGVEGTLAEMDRAEADLAQALGDGPPGNAFSATSPTAPAPPAAPGAEHGEAGAGPAMPPATGAQPVPRDMAPPKAEAKSKEDDAGGCNIAKRALGSLQRAAEHLCGLTGDADPRCDTARGRAQRAADRVGAACPP